MARNLIKLMSSIPRNGCLTSRSTFLAFKENKANIKRFVVGELTIYSKSFMYCGAPISIKIRQIHLSSPNRALPPVLVFLLRPIAKLGAIIFGRYLRKWWQKLSPEQREMFVKKVRSRQTHIAAVGTCILGFGILYYVEHLTEDPITKRRRFILFDDEQMKAIAQFEFENQVARFKSDIVPIQHPIYRRIARVVSKLLVSNTDLPQIKKHEWAITVIDRPEITNAFVLPHGKIFVFTGMLNVCTNDDQLAVVLSHEISHAILSHVAESMSKIFLVEMILLIPSIVFWALFSDPGAVFSEWLANALAQLLVHLPFSRSIEKEADVVGLQLAAKSCYDVREAPVFWAKMKIVNESPIPVEWLSTHPSHETRQLELQELVPLALKIRAASHCPLLGPVTPSQYFYGLR